MEVVAPLQPVGGLSPLVGRDTHAVGQAVWECSLRAPLGQVIVALTFVALCAFAPMRGGGVGLERRVDGLLWAALVMPFSFAW